eukprot:c18272_g1_i2 orf=659-1780(-)
MPINNYKGFKRMATFCKTKVPSEIIAALEPIKDDDKAVAAYGIHLGTEMCKHILSHGIKSLHLYSLNLEKSVIGILQNVGLIDITQIKRPLPWRPSVNIRRIKENVRPIFWANRPRSYISRTTSWEEYPHGRWGDSCSPGYGTLNDYQFLRRRSRNKKIQDEWVVPLSSVEDVQELFSLYCAGKLKSNPWSELEGLQPETFKINDKLVHVNSKGFFTINSQPAVNGEKSDSPSVGWGGLGGYVYQKAYVEFFCSPEKLKSLIEKAKDAPSLTYMAVNCKGETFSNIGPNDVNAVTWGVFPAKEVVQPTVVDPVSFMVWKDEAFQAWEDEWASLYPDGDPSRKILLEIKYSYFLVSLVDNCYIEGDIFSIFEDL